MRVARTLAKAALAGSVLSAYGYLQYRENPNLLGGLLRAKMADGCPPPKAGPKTVLSQIFARIWVFSDKNGNPLANGFLTPEGYFIGLLPQELPAQPIDSFNIRQLSDETAEVARVLPIKILGTDQTTRLIVGKVELTGLDLGHAVTKPDNLRADKVNIGEKVFLVGADAKLQIELNELLVLQGRVKAYYGLKGGPDEDTVKEPVLHSFKTNCRLRG